MCFRLIQISYQFVSNITWETESGRRHCHSSWNKYFLSWIYWLERDIPNLIVEDINLKANNINGIVIVARVKDKITFAFLPVFLHMIEPWIVASQINKTTRVKFKVKWRLRDTTNCSLSRLLSFSSKYPHDISVWEKEIRNKKQEVSTKIEHFFKTLSATVSIFLPRTRKKWHNNKESRRSVIILHLDLWSPIGVWKKRRQLRNGRNLFPVQSQQTKVINHGRITPERAWSEWSRFSRKSADPIKRW